MDQYKVKAKSSSGGYYEVTLTNSGTSIAVFCTCDAGVNRKLCRHKIGILDGNINLLFDQDEKDVIDKIKSLADKSTYPDLRKTHLHIKAEIEFLQKKEKHAKTNIETAMKMGLSLTMIKEGP